MSRARSGKKRPPGDRDRDPFVKATSLVGFPRSFETEDGGTLRVEPGEVALSFRLERHPDDRGEEPIDTASCFTRIADAAGDVWELESRFSLNVFIEKMVNLDRGSWLLDFDKAPKEWKKCFSDGCLMSGATTLLDDRSYRNFLVGDREVEVPFKYQCPTFDVAFLLDPETPYLSRLLVRVSGFVDSKVEEVPPLVYESSWLDLIFRNELFLHPEEGGWQGEGWPLPIRFRKVGFSGAAEDLVRYVPGGS